MPDVLVLRWRMTPTGLIYAMVGDDPSDQDVVVGIVEQPIVAEHVVLLHNASLVVQGA